MKILRLVLSIGPTSAPYNQFTLPVLDVHDVTLCTYFPSEQACDRRVDYQEGNGRLGGFLRNLRTLLRTRAFDVVHIHSPHLSLLFLLVALVTAPSLISRTVLHIHSSYATYRRRNRWMLLPGFLAYGRIICCSHSSRTGFPWLYRQLAGRRLMTICNGVDLARVDAAWRFREWGMCRRERDLRLISVGALRALKNHATVIHGLALTRANDVSLTIVGDGPQRRELEALVESLGLQNRVEFLGRLPRDAVLRRLWEADAFVSLSRGEGLPVAVLEAMSCHCPVILSDLPAHREIRSRRKDLVPLIHADDSRTLAHAIDAWSRMPLDVLRAWGADCREHVERTYALDFTLDQLEDVFDELDPTITPEWAIFCRCMRRKMRQRKAA